MQSWVESYYRGRGKGLGVQGYQSIRKTLQADYCVFSMGRGVHHGNTTIIYHRLFQRDIPSMVERSGWHWEVRRLESIIERTPGEEDDCETASLWKCIFYSADKMLPFKKTLAELYSLIFLLIKPSLLRCENDSRLVINCRASHYFKNDLSPKGAGVAQSTIASRSAPTGQWVFRCLSYHKKKGEMNAKCPGILNNHNSQFFGEGRWCVSMGEIIVLLAFIL